jgi:pyruvate/2-oxoacid:ferredoxin oxidoreductase beta subunit
MLKKDKSATVKDVEQIVTRVVNQVVSKVVNEVVNKVVSEASDSILTGMDKLYSDLDLKIEESKQELSMQIDSLDRKFVSQQNRLDLHNKRIETLEKIHPNNQHDFVVA